jgi:MOSC domain-containing protein YiiM
MMKREVGTGKETMKNGSSMTDEKALSHRDAPRGGHARVLQISVNPEGGVPKRGVLQARLQFNNVEGDRQNDTKHHGGPERAVCLFSWEVIRELQDEGHPIDCGTAGENLTISGLDWSTLALGARLQIGAEALLEITRPTTPCYKIAASFVDGNFNRIAHKLFPDATRYYARVLREGTVCQGDRVTLLPASR